MWRAQLNAAYRAASGRLHAWLGRFGETAAGRAGKRLVRGLAFPLLLVLVTELVIHVINPFGIEKAIEARVALVIQREAAAFPCSPFKHCEPETRGQKAVTVVLVNRAFATSAAALGVKGGKEPVWPLPVTTMMNDVMGSVLRYRPAAVFVDIVFPHAPRQIAPGSAATPGESAAALGKRLAMLDQDPGNPPIILSDLLSGEATRDCPSSYVPTDALGTSGAMSGAIRSAAFGRPGGVLLLADTAVLGEDGSYRLAPATTGARNDCRIRARARDNFLLSPALTLLWAYCARHHCDGEKDADLRKLASHVRPAGSRDQNGFGRFQLSEDLADANELELRWRSNLTLASQQLYGDRPGADLCAAQFQHDTLEPFAMYAMMLSQSLERHFASMLDRPCPYIETVLPNELDDPAPGQPAKSAQRLGDVMVRDRIVLIGVDLPQAGDRYTSPINGEIPGVYVHAAALENMLSRGTHFARAEASGAQIALLYLIDALMVWLFEWLWRRLSRIFEPWLKPVGELVIAPALFLVAGFAASAMVFWLLEPYGFPLIEVALPIAALHLVLFGRWVMRFTAILGAWLGIEDEPQHH